MKRKALHLEIQHYKQQHYGVLRTTYWDKQEKKSKHTAHGRLTGLDLETLRLVQAAIQGRAALQKDSDIPKVLSSKEFGASRAVLKLVKTLELDRVIYSQPNQQWVKDCLAMVVGRLIYAGSKLGLSNRHKDSALWELCGVPGSVDVEKHCYKSMDLLLARQEAIQKKLAKKHFDHSALVLYDITSSYFEGEYEGSQLVQFGYNRDQKRGHEQIVIGLICSSEGCPIGVEVFPGNTKDETTVIGKIAELQERYQIKELIFVGDRGMVTHSNIEKAKSFAGLNTISALTHPEILKLLRQKVVQRDMFDEQMTVEVEDPDEPKRRYCLCCNPLSARRETETRKALLERTSRELNKIAVLKRKSSVERISARVGKMLAKTKMGKFVDWRVVEGQLQWALKQEAIDAEQLLDGCYVISTDVSKATMDAKEVVAAYKKLMLVEKAFRNLKTVQLEVRPIYHKTDKRIRCHVFLCMLAYYLQWHIMQRCQSLFQRQGAGKNRFWTFANILERLKSIRRERVMVQQATFDVVTDLDEDQAEILELLQVTL